MHHSSVFFHHIHQSSVVILSTEKNIKRIVHPHSTTTTKPVLWLKFRLYPFLIPRKIYLVFHFHWSLEHSNQFEEYFAKILKLARYCAEDRMWQRWRNSKVQVIPCKGATHLFKNIEKYVQTLLRTHNYDNYYYIILCKFRMARMFSKFVSTLFSIYIHVFVYAEHT